LPRSRFRAECISSCFTPKEDLTTEGVLLKKDLEHIKELMAMRDAEITELKEADGRLWQEWHDANERPIRYQLPVLKPKKSF